MSSEGIYYRVSYAGRVKDELISLEARATAVGRLAEYTQSLRIINAWLGADPTSLGEPTKDYVAMRLTEDAGGYGPLSVMYAVHWDLKLVFVTKPLQIFRWAGF